MPGDENEQFVEVAVPAAADITDWSVRILDPSPGSDTIVTNVLGVFGVYGLSATKADNMGMASNMVFRVLATPLATNTPPSEIMKKADGTLDATWGWAVTNYCSAISSASGKIEYFQPFGLQLVRPSGIVEHSVVCIGKDIYSEEFGLDDYNPTNAVAKLNRVMNTTNFFYVGSEDYGADASVGVLAGSGSSSNQWSHAMKRSPGRINVAFDGTVQEFPDNDPPTPNGTSIIVYSSVDTEFGHIRQTVGEAEQTTAPQIIVLKKGSETGTNITYHVDPWFELGTVTENGKPADPATTIPGSREYVVTVGVGASNNVTVVAAAQVKDSLRLLGVSDDNPYKDAMIDWFVHHGTLYGDWENPDADEVKLAKYWPIGNTPKSMATDLTLTEMYWLDMDPTVGDLYLRGGWADPAHPRGGDDPETVNNIRMAVKLYITNATDFATSPHYGEYWAPYVLRGLAPGETSWAYKTNPEWNWTSVTFKVSGIIQNGQTSTNSYESAVPLRYFVFNEDSFDEDCTSRIEVKDPRGPESPAVGEGWDKWPDSNIFYLWQINRRRKQWEVENLEQENYYP